MGWTVCSDALVSGKLETYRSKRSAQKTPEPMGEDAGERRRPALRHPGAPRHPPALGPAPGARRRRSSPGRSPTACPRRPRTTASRSTPRTIRSSTSSSRARSPRASTAPARCAIWDRGTYEVAQVGAAQDRGRACTASALQGALRALPDRQGRGAQELDDPPHGPARRRGGRADARQVVPMLARAGTLPRDDEQLGLRGQVGRRARDLPLRAGPHAPALAQPATTSPRAIPSSAPEPRAQPPPRGARRRGRRLRRRRPPELRRAAAAHARQLGERGPAPGQGDAGHLRRSSTCCGSTGTR